MKLNNGYEINLYTYYRLRSSRKNVRYACIYVCSEGADFKIYQDGQYLGTRFISAMVIRGLGLIEI